MKKRHVAGHVKTINQETEGLLEAAVGSTAVIDRHGEVIQQEGWDLKNFVKNPVLLWSHNASFNEARPPIGKVINTRVIGRGKSAKLVFDAQFDMKDSFAAEIYRKMKEGFLSAFSVGLLVKNMEDNIITNAELLEISVVPVPANPEALNAFKGFKDNLGKDIKPVDWEHFFTKAETNKQVKKAVPYKASETTEDGAEWDAGEALKRVKEWAGGPDALDWKKYQQAFAWYNPDKTDDPDSYKLLHHDIVMGKLTTIWRGTAAAMSVLLGAKSGEAIPEEDRKDVYEHLVKHYAQYDKQAPDYKFVEDQALASLSAEIGVLQDTQALREVKHMSKKVDRIEKKVTTKQHVIVTNDDVLAAMKILSGAVNNALRIARRNQIKGGE